MGFQFHKNLIGATKIHAKANNDKEMSNLSQFNLITFSRKSLMLCLLSIITEQNIPMNINL